MFLIETSNKSWYTKLSLSPLIVNVVQSSKACMGKTILIQAHLRCVKIIIVINSR